MLWSDAAKTGARERNPRRGSETGQPRVRKRLKCKRAAKEIVFLSNSLENCPRKGGLEERKGDTLFDPPARRKLRLPHADGRGPSNRWLRKEEGCERAALADAEHAAIHIQVRCSVPVLHGAGAEVLRPWLRKEGDASRATGCSTTSSKNAHVHIQAHHSVETPQARRPCLDPRGLGRKSYAAGTKRWWPL